MARQHVLASPVDAPVELALVLICEKCGKRLDAPKHNPAHELASVLKKLAKADFGRGQVRCVLTSCMDLCPEERVAVGIAPSAPGSSMVYLEADVDDVDAAARSLVRRIARLADERTVIVADD